MITANENGYVSTKDCAKLIRKALKTAFPRTKFSVRTESYSMGSHVNVSWTDGPTQKQVEAITDQFYGDSFDGMIDMKYHFSSWLLPDGTAIVAKNSGTEGSMGSVSAYENAKPHPNAQLVKFHGSRPSLRREVSERTIELVKAAYASLSPSERFKLLTETRANHVYGAPDSFSLEDATLADFGNAAKDAFEVMARNIAA